MKYKLLLFIGLTVLLTAVSLPAFTQSNPEAPIATITIDPNANQLQTLSVIEAPFTFNAVVPSWVATGEPPEIHIRTSKDGQTWSDWYHIEAHDDWNMPEDTEAVGDMIIVPEVDGTHRYLEYELGIENEITQLSSLSFTFIDTTDGPTTQEMLIRQQQLDTQNLTANTDGYPRPTVISREVWCIYDDCDYTAGLEYEPATHMIVHHTVSSNSSGDWAATVRAIWRFHTYPDSDSCSGCRGWGDIGYNYLVDRTGVIYEGHMNEDYLNLDVIGTHASAANAGSLGTSLIGTFTNSDEYPTYDVPPAPMMNAVTELFAWKADQRNIEIYDASRTVNMNWGLPHIMGHRDVYGGTNTLCPGGNAHDLLPWLRAEVSSRIGQVSPFTFVSEESSAFTKANANWNEARRGCGWQGHAYYTWTTTELSSSTNWGEWQINAPATGLYEIQVYAPYCDTDNSETNGATYEIDNGVTTKTAVVSHQENVGLWMTLGAYELTQGNNTLRLTDLTATDSGVGIWFDDVRFRPATDVNVTNIAPENDSWLTQQTVDFEWTIDNPTLVQTVTLEIATDNAFTNIIEMKEWETAVTIAQHAFPQDYLNLYWRVSADTGGATTFSTPTRFGIDSTAPESNVTGLTHHVNTGTFDVTWAGSDATSGIASYNIDYKAEGVPTWTRWLTNSSEISGTLTLPNANELIWFRSQAIDYAGNVEAESSGDLRSDQATVIFNPAAQNSSPMGNWINDPTVLFDWTLTEIDDVTNSTIEIATDQAFTNIVSSEQTNNANSQHEFMLTADDGDLYWHVTVEFTPPLPGLASTVTSEPSWFGLDTTPPTSTVTAVYTITNNLYMIATAGADAHSGISQINLEYQAEGDIDWIPWTNGFTFIPPEAGIVYHFRTQAIDVAGNLEPPHTTSDMNLNQAKPIPHVIMLPVIKK